MIPMQDWLYIVGRVKPGVALAPLQEKVSALCCGRRLQRTRSFHRSRGKTCAGEGRMWC